MKTIRLIVATAVSVVILLGCRHPQPEIRVNNKPARTVRSSEPENERKLITFTVNNRTGQIISTNRNYFGIVGEVASLKTNFTLTATIKPFLSVLILQKDSANNPEKEGLAIDYQLGLKMGDPVWIKMEHVVLSVTNSSLLRWACVRFTIEGMDSEGSVLESPVRFWGDMEKPIIFSGKAHVLFVGNKGEVYVMQDDNSAGLRCFPGIFLNVAELSRLRGGELVIGQINWGLAHPSLTSNATGEKVAIAPQTVFTAEVIPFDVTAKTQEQIVREIR